MLERYLPKALAMKRYAPYAAAFVLGVGSWWGLSKVDGNATSGPSPVKVTSSIERPAPKADARRPRSVARRELPWANSPSNKKPTPASAGKGAQLLNAAAKGDRANVRRLLAARVKVNSTDGQGRTALMIAVKNDRAAVAEYLIEKGANVNMASADGETALMIAARRGDPVATHLLLENGAKFSRRNSDGLTAMAIAQRNGHDVVHELIGEVANRRNAGQDRIRAAQRLLANLGYRPGKVDGQYGRRTGNAVKRFQRDNRLAVDGRISPNLISSLKRAKSKAQVARKATRRTAAARLNAPKTDQADSSQEGESMWGRTKGWFGKATSSVGGMFESGDNPQTARSDGGEKKGWLGNSSDSVGGFFKSQRDQREAQRRRCEDSGEAWVRDPSSDAWVDCSQYR